MKKFLLGLLLLAGFWAQGQSYNNEWIDFSKTYYKFKVHNTGLFRIPQSTLQAAGLGSVSASDFQLWRNGQQVPLFTTASGSLGASDYLEFWGEMNDGMPDSVLYRQRGFQLNPKWSLHSDTAVYFLTVNAGANLRLVNTPNNVAGTTLTPEPYFLYKTGVWARDQINPGYAVNVGDYMYSSSYDRGEGWSSGNIGTNASVSLPLTNLFPYTGAGAPQAKILAAVSGNAVNQRSYRITINGDSTIGGAVNYFNELVDSTNFPVSRISTGTANMVITNVTPFASDRMVYHRIELTYPRQFNFGAANSFEFTLGPSTDGQYLQITNFSGGSGSPILYDLTNGWRLVANMSVAGQYRFVLPPSATDHRLVLVRSDGNATTTVSSLQSRTFTDYQQVQNQADYLIITSPLLTAGPNGSNPVEEYRAYRSSQAGGGYAAKVFYVQDLVDQFGFGIKSHPMALVNFIRFARNRFSAPPRQVFLIGKGVTYNQARLNENNALYNTLCLVPTFGNPASDNMLTAEYGTSKGLTPIGRLSVVSATELANYLNKVKQFEQAQQAVVGTIAGRAWMKNIVHLAGSTEPQLLATLSSYFGELKAIIADTLYGGSVTTFIKNSPNTVEQIQNGALDRLFAEGISMITYFGHSAASHLEYNLSNPDQYNNLGKYPLFVALGCNVGNVYNFSASRLSTLETISEQYTMAPNRGSIGFVASSHFGITDYLQNLARPLYYNISAKNYGATIGEQLQAAASDLYSVYTEGDFYARATAEETNLNGDPAIRLNWHAKPDYVIEDPLVRVSPGFVSVANTFFHLTAQSMNIGRAVNKPVVIEVTRQFPAGNTAVIFRDTIPGIRYLDSIGIDIPIEPNRDKGLNRITVTIDADNNVDEAFENNNSVTKDIFIYEDEARPVYPYNYAIVNRQNLKFIASTANPFLGTRNYRMQLDTTELFNSPVLSTTNLNSTGGILEFAPTVTLRNNTVYYWRVAEMPASGTPNWSTSSFLYQQATDSGFNQSHVYQHFKSDMWRIRLDSASRQFRYNPVLHELYIRNGVWGTATGQAGDLVVNVDGYSYIRNTCVYGWIFNVLDGTSLKPWVNGTGLYGSQPGCSSPYRRFNFEYLDDSASRRRAMEFIRQVPAGNYIVVRNQPYNYPTHPSYRDVNNWITDRTRYGTGNTLYDELKNAGFTLIDSINKPRVFAFVYRKGDPAFAPIQGMSIDKFDVMSMTAIVSSVDSVGSITSPRFGPAAAWKRLQWNGASLETPSADTVLLSLVGVRPNGTPDTLIRNIRPGQNDIDISWVDPNTYPYVQLHLNTVDTVKYNPWQLDYWRVLYSPKAEGAVAPNMLFEMKDSFDLGEPVTFRMAFKNISDVAFDSLKVKAVITDQNNVAYVVPLGRFKKLVSNDTLTVRFPIDTRRLAGMNSLFVDVNPDNDQPELYHFNNFIYKNFFVRGDSLNPLLDVTFDSRHILNGDIVASKPQIDVRLKDESRFRLLDDTALMSLQVIYPSGATRSYAFDGDTLRFEPATSGASNQATMHFRPSFTEDGDYTLVVSGKDKSGNAAGRMDYKVNFQVINKAMISNMLNYPNPFTTSTAFVFTITGAEVPQNIRIQILTITGKIVREITKDELGPLHVGTNITEFKWDGTDQYGQKLANGVYLYRVITNLNGKSLEKFTNKGEKTDQYFNKGYGKMYLMR